VDKNVDYVEKYGLKINLVPIKVVKLLLISKKRLLDSLLRDLI